MSENRHSGTHKGTGTQHSSFKTLKSTLGSSFKVLTPVGSPAPKDIKENLGTLAAENRSKIVDVKGHFLDKGEDAKRRFHENLDMAKGVLDERLSVAKGVSDELTSHIPGKEMSEEALQDLDLFNGQFTTIDAQGSLARKYQLVKGKPEGMIEDYHEGRLGRKFNVNEGVLEGEMESYDGHGNLESKITYHEGQLDGPSYHYSNNKLTMEMFFEKGVQQGLMKTYHANGVLQSVVTYKNGRMDQLHQVFDEQGQFVRVCHYKEGLLDGEMITYYSGTGKPASKNTYKMDKLDGPSIQYDSQGRILHENNYKEGRLDGKQVSYHTVSANQAPVVAVESTYHGGSLKDEKHYDEKGHHQTSPHIPLGPTPAEAADKAANFEHAQKGQNHVPIEHTSQKPNPSYGHVLHSSHNIKKS